MKQPFFYATGAAIYIVIIVLIINVVTSVIPGKSLLIPMAMLSLFVLSAAIMGFLFLSQPFFLFMENKKEEAILFFLKIVGVFAIYVAIFFVFLFQVSF